jgi:general secretion pathway protein D
LRRPTGFRTRPALDSQSLIDNITSNIQSNTWDDVGGPGAIQPFTNAGALVISQTTQVQEEITEFLKALRDVGAEQEK